MPSRSLRKGRVAFPLRSESKVALTVVGLGRYDGVNEGQFEVMRPDIESSLLVTHAGSGREHSNGDKTAGNGCGNAPG